MKNHLEDIKSEAKEKVKKLLEQPKWKLIVTQTSDLAVRAEKYGQYFQYIQVLELIGVNNYVGVKVETGEGKNDSRVHQGQLTGRLVDTVY